MGKRKRRGEVERELEVGALLSDLIWGREETPPDPRSVDNPPTPPQSVLSSGLLTFDSRLMPTAILSRDRTTAVPTVADSCRFFTIGRRRPAPR